jgi:hypothetical protein
MGAFPIVDSLRGWHIWHDARKPATGQWQAQRHGVNMCAGSYDGIVSMILNREELSKGE